MQENVIQSFRLSPQQKHLWSLLEQQQAAPFLAQCAVSIEGSLDTEMLRSALAQIVERHEILHTAFQKQAEDTFPVQVIDEPGFAFNADEDLSGSDEAQQQARIEQVWQQMRRSVFDLGQSPLLHSVLITLSSQRHVLLLTLPALCADATSMSHLANEIFRSYTALAFGDEPGDDPMQYADLSEWQNELLEQDETEAGRNYWRQKNYTALKTFKLPFGNRAPRTAAFTPAHLSRPVEPGLRLEIEKLVERCQVSLETFFLAGWLILLSRLSEEPNLIVGLGYDGRRYEEFKDVIGLFVKHLPLDIRLDEQLSFEQLLKHLDETMRAASKRQEYFNWEQIEASGREVDDAKFFPACFDYLKESADCSKGDLRFFISRRQVYTDQFEIKLSCVEASEQLSTEFHYDAGIYRAEEIERVEALYGRLIDTLSKNEETAIGALEVLSEDERREWSLDLPDRSAVAAGKRRPVRPLSKRTAQEARAGLTRRSVHEQKGLPLSFAQQRLWFLDQLDPRSSAYNIAAAVRLSGRLHIDAFERTINEIVRRHEVLRTTFAQESGQPVQIISPPAPQRLEVVDLSGLKEEEREARAQQLAAEESHRPFDLSQGPLLRVRLIRLQEEVHIVLFLMHHIVSDGWSMGIFVREIAALYNAFSGDAPSPLEELPVQYADYAVWQREWLQGEVLEAELNYWKQQLADAPPLLELPADRPRPALQSYQGARVAVAIPQGVTEELKRLSRQEGVTLFMTLITAYKTLLARYSGQTDIVVGTPVANRDLVEIEGLIGFFVNTLVLRTDLSGDPDFLHLLKRVREVTLDAYTFQNAPFEMLVEVLHPARSLSHTPLFQVTFSLQNAASGTLQIPGLAFVPLDSEMSIAKFDLELNLNETAQGLVGTLDYNTDLFDRSTVELLVKQYETLLQSIVDAPGKSISELDLLTSDDMHELLVTWNDTRFEHSLPASEMCLHKLFAAQAARTPGAIAAIYEGDPLTYAELNARADQLARRLRSSGVGPEVRVGICAERSLEMVIGLLAVLKAGGAYVPLDPTYPPERLSFMLEDSEAQVLLTQQHLLKSLPSHAAKVLLLDEDPEGEPFTGEGEIESGVGPKHLAYFIYTSGSTGKPKGVMITHGAICNHMLWMLHKFRLDPADRVLQKTPLSFDASLWELFVPLFAGAQLIMARPGGQQDSAYLAEAICQQQITILQLVPSMLRIFLDEEGVENCHSLRYVVCGGEKLTAEDQRRFVARLPHVTLHNLYGPTEASIDATYWQCEKATASNIVPIGRPIANVQIYILDENLRPLPPQIPGELHIGGDGLARGYLNRAELTAEKFIPDPFSQSPGARLYKTGDLARYLPGGVIDYLGRIDHQVKLRGFRIELGEIEATLQLHPSVRECVVLLREEMTGGHLEAYVTATEGEAPTGKELREWVRDRLPEYMVPPMVSVLAVMPLTSNGKIDRRALLSLGELETGLDATYVAPRTPVEEVLAEIWGGVLGAARPGVHDNFFDLGGHSLLAMQVMSRIRAAFHLDLRVRALFEAPTISALAENISQMQQGAVAGETVTAGQPESGDSLQEPHALVRVARDRQLPLSFAQQRLWVLEQLESGNAAYHLATGVRITGRLNVAALERTIDEIVKRHESLRTSFAETDGRPVQLIADPAHVPLDLVDLTALPEPEREIEAGRFAVYAAQRPFDLACAPLMRVHLLRLQPDEHIVLLVMHHIISDGWSMGILVREVSTLYEAYSRGRESPLPSLPVQYADYAVWQREWLSEAVMEEQLAYWRAQLGGELPVLELPADHARPARQSHRGAQLPFTLPEPLAARLRELSGSEGATMFMTLLAAFQLLLSRYSGQSEIVVGTPIANRDRVELESLIGFFVNTLVLRTDLSGDPSFRGLLERVREVTLGAYAHQHVPFERLVDELEPERDLSRNPLFQVMFILQNTPMGELALSELSVSQYGVASGAVQFDLTLSMVETGSGLAGIWEYNADLFEAATIKEMLRHWQQVLEVVTHDAGARLSELSWLTPEDERLLLVEWNDTRVEYPPDESLHGMFEAQVERRGEVLAVVDEAGRLSYAELDERANKLANHLQRHGVGTDSLVGVCLERSVEMVVALLGVLKAGAAYVPLDPAYPAARLSYMLEDADVSVLLTEERLLAQLPANGARVIAVDSARKVIAAESGERPESGVRPDNLAYVIYTSGSTGQPKGAMNTHRAICNRLRWMQEAYGLEESDRVLQKTPFSFDVSVWEFFWPLMTGARLVMARPGGHQDSLYLARTLQREGITTLHFVPSMLRAFLEQLDEAEAFEFDSLRRVICSGEALTTELQERFFARLSCELHNLYGPTEAAVDVTSWACRAGETRRTVPIGKPIANTQIYILGTDGQLVAPRVAGELHIGGVSLARGYLKRAGLTAEKFIPDEWSGEAGSRLYRTGDRARFLPDGNIEYLGRIDHQVKLRGMRIELGEIEATLKGHALVRDCVALVRMAQQAEARLEAYLVIDEAGGLTGSELRVWLKERLPEYMIPQVFVMLDEIPLSPNGKIDRRALLESGGAEPELTTGYVAPRSLVEQMVAGIWEEVLGVERVGLRDNFFELGGHSLLAMQVISRVRRACGVEVELRWMFEDATVAGLASRVEESLNAGAGVPAPPLEPAPRDRDLPLSFAQQRLWFIDQLEAGGSAYNVATAMRLSGQLDVGALEQTFDEIVRRHEVLRTTFATVDGQPTQVVAESLRVRLETFDLSRLMEAEREETARRMATEEAQRPFNLAQGPLLRLRLLKLDADEHIVLLTMHHIISDGWSMGVLIGEVTALYEAYSRGRESPLPSLPVQYADYAVWQREWLRGEALAEHLDFWEGQLAGVPPLLELPTDRPRPAVQGYHGARARVEISKEVSERLRALSRSEGATMFMTLLAVFKILLHRYSGQSEIVVGTPIANRDRVELESLIGFFVNTLVLRSDLSGDLTFRQLLARVRETTLGAYAHQHLPFEQLVDRLQPVRNLSHNPLFQVMFILQNAQAHEPELGGLKLTPLEISSRAVQFDLTLSMAERAEGLEAVFEYNTDLYDGATIERMLQHLAMLAESIVTSHGEARLSELEMMPESERRLLLAEWNETTTAHPLESCIHALFERQAEQNPAAAALVSGTQRLTYGELNERSNRLARYLQKLGVGAEARVGICVERSVEMVVGLLGILKAGGAYVPLDPSYPQERLAFMIEDAQPLVLLTLERFSALLDAEGVPVVRLDGDWERIAQEDASNPANDVRPDNLAYIIYTSGSTGRPKGVAIEHRQSAALLYWARDVFPAEDLSGVLAATSINFDLSVFELYVTLGWGGTVILAENALELPALPAANEVRLINTVPSAIAELLRTGGIPRSVRIINLAGEALSPKLVNELYQLDWVEKIFNLYGPSEDTTYSTFALMPRGEHSSVSIGRPLANKQGYILDRELRPVALGLVGEMYIGGAGLARGYFNRPELTAERFIPNPFSAEPGARLYRTGDLVRYLRDGNIEYLGRIDHQVKLRGFRIELGEIETALATHGKVLDAVVIVREDVPGEKRLVGYVVAQEREEVTGGELREHLQSRLPDYMIPSLWIALAEMPLTPSGKIDRRALPAPERDKLRLDEEFVEPRTEHERVLAKIWAQALGLARVGVHDNFFHLGGDSILSIQIIARANQAGLRLTPRQVFQHQTIAELATVAGTSEAALAEQGAVTGDAPLTPIQHWFFERIETDRHHFNQSVMLEVREGVEASKLREVMHGLLAHHDALRLRFEQQEHGWSQIYLAPSEPFSWTNINLADVPDDEQATTLEASAAEIQASLDLTTGPIARAVFYELGVGKASRLLLVIHHLAIDGVSWRILLEDLHLGYEQLSRGAQLALSPKTTSFKRWAERLVEFAQTPRAQEELSYWLDERRAEIKPMPIDVPETARTGDVNTAGTTGLVTVSLTAEETRSLLQEVPQSYRTEINDALLAALALAFRAWTGETRLLLDLEGHGREELLAEDDVSRTVGWFTSLFPVLLDTGDGDASPVEILKRVKEQLRAIPRRGAGFGALRYLSADEGITARLQSLPQPEVIFNYLGQLDQVLFESALFNPAGESSGPPHSPRQQRTHLLEISGSIGGGQLQLLWAYSKAIHRRGTIEKLAAGFLGALKRIIEDCRAAGAGGYTPSDFPLVKLKPSQLDELTAAHDPITDLYPLSPVQQGMYFHYLTAAEGGMYVEQISCGLRGELDLDALKQAWHKAVERHTILRSSFYLGKLDEPLQLVHEQAALPFAEHDWRHLAAAEQQATLDSYLETDRRRGLNPSDAPLIRLALIRTGEQAYQFIWTFHHLILDGWSVAQLFGEVLASYNELAEGRQLALERPRPFRDYIAWLAQQDLSQAETFWRETLQGFSKPTPIGAAYVTPDEAQARQGYDEVRAELSASTTEGLQALARNQQLTLNSIVQGAWAWVLSQYSDEPDVLFGVTVSGRPAELQGVESMIGMFINTLPVRTRIESGERTVDWLKRLQQQQSEMRQYEYAPLVQVQGWSGVPQGVSMFESLFVFENYPIEATAREQQSKLEIVGVDAVIRTSHRLTVVAAPGAQLTLTIAYERRRFTDETIARLLAFFKSTVESLARNASETLSTLPVLSEQEREQLSVEWKRRSDDGAGEAIDFVAPRTATEEKLAGMWAEVIGLERLSIYSNFFDLGGHSLLATQLISRVREGFEVEIPLRDLFEMPTVALLAAHIDKAIVEGRGLSAPPLRRVSREASLPLSFAQQRLWILHQFDPETAAFNIPVAVRLSGQLDANALAQTLNEIVARHEILRTVFGVEQGEPVQIILPAEAAPLPLRDLSEMPFEEAEEAARELAAAEASRPFDLRHGPVLRAMLIKLSDTEHVVLLTMHHIVSDGWSTSVLVREVVTLYEAFAQGRHAALPELPVQYADFAHWQRQWMQGEVLREHLSYWERQLRGAATLALPTDRPRPTMQSYRGAEQLFSLPLALTNGLKSLAEEQGCTLFMVLLAAFQTLLQQRAGQDDIVVGTDVANRNRLEIEPLIGFFVNQLVLRADFTANPTFRQLLDTTRRLVFGAYEHQDLPFEKIVEVLKPERDQSRAPLFQVKFVFQNTPNETLELPGLKLSPLGTEPGATQLDLILFMEDNEEGLIGRWQYNTDLFESLTIAHMGERFAALLQALTTQPDTPVKFIEAAGESEREQQQLEEERRDRASLNRFRKVKPKAIPLAVETKSPEE
jgi:amino acid adenylation domain-containing protein/non-ribosomal peptide synthase protein (TIGR01720 family)